MQERHVTASGRTYPLPEPFFVLATQNPIEQEGTYPLPEAQLDRFTLNLRVPYPTAAEELEILRQTTGEGTATPEVTLTAEQIVAFQALVRRVPVAEYVFTYARDLTRASRPGENEATEFVRKFVSWGAGPRRPVADSLCQGAGPARGPRSCDCRRRETCGSARAAAPHHDHVSCGVGGDWPRPGDRAFARCDSRCTGTRGCEAG